MLSLTYTSRAVRPFSALELVDLLRTARDHNATESVTGLLVYAQQKFIQWLEGEDDAVERVFARIELDPRHADVRVVARERIVNREYPRWSMGFAFPDAERLAAILPGYDPHGSLARQTVVSPETARLLLAALSADAEDAAETPGP